MDVEFVACGLVSPLNVSFLDALNDLLQREQDGRVVLLNSIRMSIAKLCKLDGDSLREIWTGYWHERGVVNVTGDVISMSVADVISR